MFMLRNAPPPMPRSPRPRNWLPEIYDPAFRGDSGGRAVYCYEELVRIMEEAVPGVPFDVAHEIGLMVSEYPESEAPLFE